MVYFTGDIHGSPYNIIRFAKRMKLTCSDVIVILGDVGANYYGNERDSEMKMHLNALKPTILRYTVMSRTQPTVIRPRIRKIP